MAKKTHLALLLDYSEAMLTSADDVIAGFNAFLEAQKGLESGDFSLSLGLFNAKEVKFRFMNTDVSDVKPLNKSTFKPNYPFTTFDVAEEAVKALGRKKNVLVFIYSPITVLLPKELIDKKEAEGWVFRAFGLESTPSSFFFGLNHYIIQHRRGVEKPVWKQ